ncbi:MAG: enolase C-terminal domain-like protein [Candidatus Bathyarchaeia archaeon]
MTDSIEDFAVYVLKFPASHVLGGGKWVTETQHLIVVVKTDSNILGIGEGTPYWSSLVADIKFTFKILKKVKGLKLTEARDNIIKHQATLLKKGKFRNNYGSFLATETAVIDAIAKERNMALSYVLGGKPYRNLIPVCGTIFFKHPVKMIEELDMWVRKGVKHIKFKAPNSLNDLENVLRHFKLHLDKLGHEDLILRADFNGGFTKFEKACKAMELIEKYKIHIVEQPMPANMIRDLAKLRRRFSPSIKVMVDESLAKPPDLDIFANFEAADIVNFHPPKLGCLTITREAMIQAKKLGFEIQIGSALMTEIGLIHYLHLAASLPYLDYPLEEIGLFNIYGYSIYHKVLCIKNGKIKLSSDHIELSNIQFDKFQQIRTRSLGLNFMIEKIMTLKHNKLKIK